MKRDTLFAHSIGIISHDYDMQKGVCGNGRFLHGWPDVSNSGYIQVLYVVKYQEPIPMKKPHVSQLGASSTSGKHSVCGVVLATCTS